MCGIIHVKRFDNLPCAKMVQKRYKKQKARGSEGFGYVTAGEDQTINIERSPKESPIITSLLQEKAREILFHHRYPTSAPNVAEATHPIAVKNRKLKYHYYLVHNGIITNDEKLRTKHNALGFNYTTDMQTKIETAKTIYTEPMVWNDSEALAIEVAMVLEGVKDTIETVGSVAFVCLQVDKKTKQPVKLFFGRNDGNPLKMLMAKQFFTLSSEGEGVNITPDMLYCLDYANNNLSLSPLAIGTYYDYSGKVGSYSYGGYYNSDDIDDGTPPVGSEFDEYDRFEDDEYLQMYEEKCRLEGEIRKAVECGYDDIEMEKRDELQEIEIEIDEHVRAFSKPRYTGKSASTSSYGQYKNGRLNFQ